LSSEPEASATVGRGRASRSVTTQKWTRLIHVYTSMICLLIVLFFSATGLTLNHPTWGAKTTVSTAAGTMPASWKSGDTIDWLTVSEHLRSANDVTGLVNDHRSDGSQATIVFKGPGYSATGVIDEKVGSYQLTTEREGFLGMMNDMHKGRNTTSSWKWLIDIIAVVLIVISLSGLVLQFFLRRRRRSAYITAGLGVALTLVLMYLSVG
jgi:uncharacterized protein